MCREEDPGSGQEVVPATRGLERAVGEPAQALMAKAVERRGAAAGREHRARAAGTAARALEVGLPDVEGMELHEAMAVATGEVADQGVARVLGRGMDRFLESR